VLAASVLDQGSIQFILFGITVIVIWVVLVFTTAR